MTNYLPIALATAVVGFMLFRSLYRRAVTTWQRTALAVVAVALALPAVMFLSNYLLGTPDGRWFINVHSLPGIEATSGLVGALLGVVFACSGSRKRLVGIPILAVSTAASVILLIAPFAKQVFFRMDYSKLGDKWVNGLCLQTSSSTCVPASCATVIAMLGGKVTERELAREAGTNRRGTEIWYMRRALRRRGYEIDFRDNGTYRGAPVPCVLGVTVGEAGHVVVLMSKTAAGPEIGDPLGPRRHYAWEAFERRYHQKPAFFVIRPAGSRI